MRLFITGSTGVIGRRILPTLIARRDQVTAAVRTAGKAAALERQGCRAVVLDLFDAAAVRRALIGSDAVVNLATHIPSSSTRMLLPWAWRENNRIRREGSRILADAAAQAGATRFIQESFAPIYESGGDAWIDESSSVRPPRYARAVLDAERSASMFGSRGGAGVVLRFAAFYGPDSSMTGDFVKLLHRGMSPLPGPESAYFSMVSHDDAASAVIAALDLPSGIYNVVDDEPLRRRDLVDGLAGLVGAPPPKFMPGWTTRLMGSVGEMLSRSLRMSNRTLRASGWAPKYSNALAGWPTSS